MISAVELNAPAKVNLFLRILGKRTDGYHELVTRMVMVSCCDKVSMEIDSDCSMGGVDGVQFVIKGRNVGGDPGQNLVVRATRMVLEKYPLESIPRIKITLEKKIPVGAGLGGGSSDAAAALIGVNRLMGDRISKGDLVQMASCLGSDVPFFLGEPDAIGWGRGEKILSLSPQASKNILLWNPGFSLSTAVVYRTLKVGETNELTEAEAISRIEGLLREDDCINDLEGVALVLHPELSIVKEALSVMGAEKVMMSGSGPTLFGMFSHQDSANNAADLLVSRYGGWSGVFKTLEKSPLF